MTNIFQDFFLFYIVFDGKVWKFQNKFIFLWQIRNLKQLNMNKVYFKVLMLAMMVALLGFTACSGDDDNDVAP